jgi:hypothetical protein
MSATDTVDQVADYEAGERVRWKQGGRWRYGHLGAGIRERDGSLRIYDDTTGAARTLRPGDVQRFVRGPRGGGRWEFCEPTAPRHQESTASIREPSTGRVRRPHSAPGIEL